MTTKFEHQNQDYPEHQNNGSSSNNLSFTVGNFNFKLHKGQIVVVCGPVGSGKSTFINGIIDKADNIRALPSVQQPQLVVQTVQKYGWYSYALKDSFIINQSLRDNILQPCCY